MKKSAIYKYNHELVKFEEVKRNRALWPIATVVCMFVFFGQAPPGEVLASEVIKTYIEVYEGIESSYMYKEIKSPNKKAVAHLFKSLQYRLDFPYEDVMAVCYFESGLDHKATNPYLFKDGTHALGYIQWTPISRKEFGITYEKLKCMNEFEQVELIYDYLSRHKGKIKSFPDLYMSVYLPSYLGKPGNTRFPQECIDVNPGLGSTVAEFRRIVTNKKKKYEKENI